MTKNTKVPLTTAKRREQLQILLYELESRVLTDRELKSALTAEEWEKFDADWSSKFEAARERNQLLKSLRQVPSVLKRYADMLKVADMIAGRPNCRKTLDSWQLFKVGPAINGRYRGLESAYCHALEYLAEAMSDNPGLLQWLDRYVDFNHPDHCPAPCSDGVPRLIASRSIYANTPNKINRRAEQRITLNDSLAAIAEGDEYMKPTASHGCMRRK